MRTDLAILADALALFGRDEHGPHLRGALLDLGSLAMLDRAESASSAAIRRYQARITHDFWNIATVCERLEWMRQGMSSGDIDEEKWFMYAAVDIQSAIVELRSIGDYFARIIGGVFPLSERSGKSMRRALEWVDRNKGVVDAGVESLMLEYKQPFTELRRVRDTLLHEGGQTLVFGRPHDGILFQVTEGVTNVIRAPVVMYNQNVARFDRFMALQFASLTVFMNDVSRILIGQLKLPRYAPNTRSFSPGFEVIRRWIELTQQALAVA